MHCMPMRCTHDYSSRAWLAYVCVTARCIVWPRIMQQAVRHKASSRIPPSSLFPSWLEHPVSCKMRCYGMSFCVPAAHTRKTPLRPTAPPQHSLPRSREASASARRAATHHTPDRQTQGFLTHTSIILLSPQARASRVCHAKCGAMACRFVCLLFIHVNDSQTHCSALLTQESRGFCVSTSCGYASCSRPSDARLPQTNLHHPSSIPSSSIQGLACKMWCYGMSICVPVHTRKPPLRPTAPHKRSSQRGRRPSASARHAATHHAPGRQTQAFLTQTSITPLPYQARASRVWHAKCGAMPCRFACLLFSHVTASPIYCSTPALLTQGSRGVCVSVSCGHTSFSSLSDAKLPHVYLHHPSSPPDSSIQSLC